MARSNETTSAAEVTSTPETTASPQLKPRGIEKQYVEGSPVCRVTFTLPKEAASGAETVHVVGEFNDWSVDATPMDRRMGGGFVVTLDLEKGRAYHFRYLIDGTTFENDWGADRYEPNPYGGQDSVVDCSLA